MNKGMAFGRQRPRRAAAAITAGFLMCLLGTTGIAGAEETGAKKAGAKETASKGTASKDAGATEEFSKLMVDPAIDDTGPFCYLSKPSTQIAVPGVTKGTQFTFDGALYNGDTELCFFYGESLKPLLMRQKEMLDGWIPVYSCSWNDGPIAYRMEVFGSVLDDGPTTNMINFIRVRMRNDGTAPARAHLAAANRFSGIDHRFRFRRATPFSPDWTYDMSGDAVVRGGRLLYVFPGGAKKEAVSGTPCTGPFKGSDHNVSMRAENCLARFDRDLAPGAEIGLDFRMPATPVSVADTDFVNAIRNADHDLYRARWIAEWRETLGSGTQISIPEKKVNDACRANLVHAMEAIWTSDDGLKVQGVNKFQYNWFWLRDGAYILRTYELFGHNDLAADLLRYFERFQQDDGNFVSQKGQLDGFGQALFAFGQHYAITGDLGFARAIYPHIPPAIAWLKKARAADEFHLMPPTEARDNELIAGRYTGHNLWALLGLRHAIRLAKATGHDEDAIAFQQEYDNFLAAFLKRIDTVCGIDGPIPPGLDVEGGQDWGNLLAVYPSEILEPFDPRVTATLDKMHREKYAEGVMTYSGRLHHYLTAKVTETHVARGGQEQALQDLYHMLLHTDPTHAGFEWTAVPWGERDVGGNFPPHGWYAAKCSALIRNMLVEERGGNGGLDGRELHFFSVVSPAWAMPGKEIAIRNAPTELGPVSASLRFRNNGADFLLEPRYRTRPLRVVLHIPYIVELKNFETDASESTRTDQGIELSPDVTRVSLTWTQVPHVPLDFDTVVEQYKREYRRRYEAYRAAGNEAYPVEAPPMLAADERALEFGAAEASADKGIAVGKPVETNGPAEPGHGPELAVDGNARNAAASSWWAGPPTPRWIRIDLQKPICIDRIHIFPYWDYSRFYQYTVETSRDATEWIQVADRSRNTKPATPLGDPIRFDPVEARYVRVTMLHNSANPSVHLVEVRILAAAPEK